MTRISSTLKDQVDPKLMMSRRAFPVSQLAWAGAPVRQVGSELAIGWHDSSATGETGAIALVNQTGNYLDLIGEIIRVTTTTPGGRERSSLVYVYEMASLDVDISLSRRAFLALGLLPTESLLGKVETIA